MSIPWSRAHLKEPFICLLCKSSTAQNSLVGCMWMCIWSDQSFSPRLGPFLWPKVYAEIENAELLDYSQWDILKHPQSVSLTFWLKARSNSDIFTQCVSLSFFKNCIIKQSGRATETKWYKWAEALFRPTLLSERARMSISSRGRHTNITIYYLLEILLFLCRNIVIKIASLCS